MTENETIQQLEQRVAQLEEQQDQLVQGAIDAQGRNWTVSDFLSMGLTRRQALTAIAAIASGATVGAAISDAVGIAAADASASDSDGDVGLPSDRVDVFADGVDANTATVSSTLTDVYLSADQSISSGTTTKIQLDTALDDELGGFDASNHHVTIPEDGRYAMSLALRWKNDNDWSTGDDCRGRIMVNGGTPLINERLKISTGAQTIRQSIILSLSAGDNIAMQAFQSSGSSKSANGGKGSTRLFIGRLG